MQSYRIPWLAFLLAIFGLNLNNALACDYYSKARFDLDTKARLAIIKDVNDYLSILFYKKNLLDIKFTNALKDIGTTSTKLSDQNFFKAINDLLYKLGDTHTYIIPNFQSSSANPYLGYDVFKSKNSIRVSYVDTNSQAYIAGLRSGDYIRELNFCTNPKVSDFFIVDDEYTIRTDKGILKLERVPTFSIENSVSYSKSGKFILVRLNTFSGNLDPLMRNIIDLAEKNKDCTILFDIRYNKGGDLKNVVKVSSLVFSGGIGYTDDPIQKQRLIKTDNKYRMLGYSRIIILTSESTSSAAEIFANVLSSKKSVVSLGEATKGTSNSFIKTKTKDGSTISIGMGRFLLMDGSASDVFEPDIKVDSFDDVAVTREITKVLPECQINKCDPVDIMVLQR